MNQPQPDIVGDQAGLPAARVRGSRDMDSDISCLLNR